MYFSNVKPPAYGSTSHMIGGRDVAHGHLKCHVEGWLHRPRQALLL